MKELHGKVAVITGAASGFGREFAIRCADEGMKVILTDIDTGGLGTTVALLKPGTESLVIGSDVSSADSIEHLARSTYDRFGACHLLFNNAGVGTAGPIWTATLDDWKWALGINVMGVVHGLPASCRASWRKRKNLTSSTQPPQRGCLRPRAPASMPRANTP
jgi:NAD(P)-dependent dehydrogenase (short-subunit alcohol dehydrogenase family)